MSTDTFLRIGDSHEMCQDYILSGTDPCEYIVLADGCSTAKDSDIGARILCHMAVKQLKKFWSVFGDLTAEEIGNSIIIDALSVAKYGFNVDVECLDATLIIAFKHKGMYRVFVYGDGLVYVINKDESVDYYNGVYTPNAPCYLRYQISGKEEYEQAGIDYSLNIPSGTFKSGVGPMTPLDLSFPINTTKTLMIASDGIESFIHREELMFKRSYYNLLNAVNDFTDASRNGTKLVFQTPSPISEFMDCEFSHMAREFSNFKLTKGAFLSRRVKKVMREYLKLGYVNDDDLAIGCFYED